MGIKRGSFKEREPNKISTTKRELSVTQKQVAHKLVLGATVRMAAQESGVKESIVERWTWSRQFLEYMAKVEKRLFDQLENQTVKLRQAALKFLSECLSSDDPLERRWAVERILHATEDKTLNLNVNNGRVDDRPALSPEGKEAAKAYYAELTKQRDSFFNEVN